MSTELQTILKRLDKIERLVLRQEQLLRIGLEECKKYLAACREGYINTQKAFEMQLEETEELQNTLATCTMTEWR